MTPELEVLDQLEGGDMPLSIIVGLFPTLQHCQAALTRMVSDSQVYLLDPSGAEVPVWRLRELKFESEVWEHGTRYLVGLVLNEQDG